MELCVNKKKQPKVKASGGRKDRSVPRNIIILKLLLIVGIKLSVAAFLLG